MISPPSSGDVPRKEPITTSHSIAWSAVNFQLIRCRSFCQRSGGQDRRKLWAVEAVPDQYPDVQLASLVEDAMVDVGELSAFADILKIQLRRLTTFLLSTRTLRAESGQSLDLKAQGSSSIEVS